MRGIFSLFRHAILMLRRTLKSYLLLSVTIVLSFSLLLGYLLYTDTSVYNTYKDLFAQRPGDIYIQHSVQELSVADQFLEKAKKTGNTVSFSVIQGHGYMPISRAERDSDGVMHVYGKAISWEMYYVPDGAWITDETLQYLTADITWLDGQQREPFALKTDEVIVDKWSYYALGFSEQTAPYYVFRLDSGAVLPLKIVGYMTPKYLYGEADLIGCMVLSNKLIAAENLKELGHCELAATTVLHTDSPDEVIQLANSFGFTSVDSIARRQYKAMESIRYEKQNKTVIACTLLLLLGINLYASFSNVLNDRKFEIGVKRAIGATTWSIVRQFVYESVLIMLANTVLSAVFVADIAIIYKYIYERTPNKYGDFEKLVVYMSPHSVAIFCICAVALTVVFSLVFAYMATQVEIVQYLKEE